MRLHDPASQQVEQLISSASDSLLKVQVSTTTSSIRTLHYAIPLVLLTIFTCCNLLAAFFNDRANQALLKGDSKTDILIDGESRSSVLKTGSALIKINPAETTANSWAASTTNTNSSAENGKSKTLRLWRTEPLYLSVSFITTVICSFLLEVCLAVLHAVANKNWLPSSDFVWYQICILFTWGLVLYTTIDNGRLPDRPNGLFEEYDTTTLFTSSVSLLGEAVLCALFITQLPDGVNRSWTRVSLTIGIFRIAVTGLYILSYVLIRRPAAGEISLQVEQRQLENSGLSSKSPIEKAKSATNVSSLRYFMAFSVILRLLWPTRSMRMQLLFLVCVVTMAITRIINVVTPYQLGQVINIINDQSGNKRHMPWKEILLYLFFRYLQGNQGILNSLRSLAWNPLSQFAFRNLTVRCYDHILSLSLEYHIRKRSGELLNSISRGSSITNFFEVVFFSIAPTILDLIIAIIYFFYQFNKFFALAVLITMVSFMIATFKISSARSKYRRRMITLAAAEYNVRSEGIQNYESVKYFNAEQFEHNRCEGAISKFQNAERWVLVSLNLLNTVQGSIFIICLLASSLYSLWMVTHGEATAGTFVALITYLGQLQQPLNFFGTYFRSLQQNLIDSEKMLELFKQQLSIKDRPGACPYKAKASTLSFEHIGFSYDKRKPILKDISFTAYPGQKVAIVGETGAGKSTFFKLIFRFYEAQQGRILLNGRDIRDFQIDSVRENIGIVPQECSLFNETIMYNIKYAKPEASDEEVFEAAKVARIHEQILAFPDGYDTVTGENGMRLSGGEKQRIAIARCVLKNPSIILLDEATSALDTQTEQHIQGALEALEQGRTTLVIAHRLSTITNADQIMVVDQGKVTESGTHSELLELNGQYANLWHRQSEAAWRASESQEIEQNSQLARSQH